MAERVRRIALLLAAAAVLAACGVPGAGRPVIDGDGPTRLGGRSDLTGGNPPGPEGISDARMLVGTYLQAAAGRTEDRPARLRAFFTDSLAQHWSPGTGDVLVVRAQVGAQTLTGYNAAENGNQYAVDVTLTPVGVLDGRTGSLSAPGATEPSRATFRVVVNGMKARINAAPNGVLLDTDGLTNYYTPHTLYFWSATDRVLVPDLRYLPKGLPPEQTVVDYLLAGPSEMLRPAVVTPLPGIEPIGRPAINGGKLVLNFPAKATAQLPDLMTQLRWSLRPDYTGPIDLQVVGNSTNVDSASTDYVAANPSSRRQEDPDQYAVYGGKVVPLEGGGGPNPPQLPDVLRSPANARVVSAALSRDKDNAALVVDAPRGRELKILRLVKGTVSVTTTGVRGRNFSRPVFADAPGGFGVFVTVDGALEYVSMEGRTSRLSSPGLASYSAVAVAPDARRIAVVAAGRLYVAPLVLLGGHPELARPRRVDAGVTDLVAVAWTREERVVVAAAGSGTLREVSVDGALVDQDLPNTRQINQLVAYADNPFEGDSRGQIMYQQGSNSFALFGSVSAYLSRTVTGKSNGVTAPFYLDYS